MNSQQPQSGINRNAFIGINTNMSYQGTLSYLFTRYPMFQRIGGSAYKPGLDTIRDMAAHYGNPHLCFPSIHIAGTNGKGSVSHMLASVLQQAGYKTGLFTSPHLKDFRERIRVNGEIIPQQAVIDFTEEGKPYFETVHPSFFEITTLMAMDYFARSGVQIAVIETGMGGRLDSTNLITPLVSVITQIGKDHKEYLGDTLEIIAQEKAGIIKPGVPVIIGETQPETAPVFQEKAAQQKCSLVFADQLYTLTESSLHPDGMQKFCVEGPEGNQNLFSDLPGNYQKKNIPPVLAVLHRLTQENTWKISPEALREGLKNTRNKTGLRGRWEILDTHPMVVCDTGHNAEGIRYVTEQIRNTPHKRLHLVLGFVKDKDIGAILPLFPSEAEYYFTQPSVERALNAQTLKEKAFLTGRNGKAFDSVSDALQEARKQAHPEDMIFIGGSNFVVAEVIS